MQTHEPDIVQVDILGLIVLLLRKWWLIALSAIICGAGSFAYTYLNVTPLYQTSVMLYINNTSISVGSAKLNLSSGDLDASQQLVDTYGVILSANLTMQDIADALNENPNMHRTYSYKELQGMISSASANGTEIMRVTVTCADYEDAVYIANTVAEVLPKRISRIVDGTSVTVVDLAEYPSGASSPSYSRQTMLGMIAGAVASVAMILIYSLFIHDSIDSEDWIRETFGEELPVLAVIPEVGSRRRSKHGKYYYNNYGYYATSNKENKKEIKPDVKEKQAK